MRAAFFRSLRRVELREVDDLRPDADQAPVCTVDEVAALAAKD